MAWNQHNAWTAPSNWNQHNIWASTSAYNPSPWRQAICPRCQSDFDTQDATHSFCYRCRQHHAFGAIGDQRPHSPSNADSCSSDGSPQPPSLTDGSSLDDSSSVDDSPSLPSLTDCSSIEDSSLSEASFWSDEDSLAEDSDPEESPSSEESTLSTESSPFTAGDDATSSIRDSLSSTDSEDDEVSESVRLFAEMMADVFSNENDSQRSS